MSSRRALLVGSVGLGLAAAASCALGTFWVIGRGEPPVERVRVTVEQQGASAAEIDRAIAAPLGAALSELEGSEVTIASTEGRAEAMVELPGEGTALERVRERLAALALPEAARPMIARAPRGPALRWLVRGEHAAELQRMVRARVEAAAGQEVRTCARQDEVHVIVEVERAAAYGLGAVAVADALGREDVEVPAGIVEGAGGELRMLGRMRDPIASIAETTIRAPVRIADVASIEHAEAPHGCACVIERAPCASGAVIADAAGEGRVREALSRVEEEWPPGYTLTWVDAALTFAASAASSRDDRYRLGESLAGAARVEGVRQIAIEIAPEAGPGDLTLLVVVAPGADAGAVLARARAAVARVPGALLLPPEGAAEVEIAGDDLEILVESARAVQSSLEQHARVVPNGVDRAPELRVDIDRGRAAQLGVTEAELAREIRMAAGGEVVTHYRDGADEHAVRVRTDGSLDTLRVSTAAGSVPLSAVATLTHELAPAVLHRCGAQRCVRLAIDGDAGALEQAEERLPSIELPPGVTLRWRAPRGFYMTERDSET